MSLPMTFPSRCLAPGWLSGSPTKTREFYVDEERHIIEFHSEPSAEVLVAAPALMRLDPDECKVRMLENVPSDQRCRVGPA